MKNQLTSQQVLQVVGLAISSFAYSKNTEQDKLVLGLLLSIKHSYEVPGKPTFLGYEQLEKLYNKNKDLYDKSPLLLKDWVAAAIEHQKEDEFNDTQDPSQIKGSAEEIIIKTKMAQEHNEIVKQRKGFSADHYGRVIMPIISQSFKKYLGTEAWRFNMMITSLLDKKKDANPNPLKIAVLEAAQAIMKDYPATFTGLKLANYDQALDLYDAQRTINRAAPSSTPFFNVMRSRTDIYLDQIEGFIKDSKIEYPDPTQDSQAHLVRLKREYLTSQTAKLLSKSSYDDANMFTIPTSTEMLNLLIGARNYLDKPTPANKVELNACIDEYLKVNTVILPFQVEFPTENSIWIKNIQAYLKLASSVPPVQGEASPAQVYRNK